MAETSERPQRAADGSHVIPTPIGWWRQMRAVPYREVLNVPGIARAHDLQRLMSYGLGVAVALLIDMPAWRIAFVVGVSGVLLLLAARRLIGRNRAAPYPLALSDLVLATLVVAVATASPLISLSVAGVVALAIAASFDAPPGLSVGSAALTLILALPLAMWLGDGPLGVPDSMMALVLIVLLLSIAVLILVFFTFQARQLRRTLDNRELQLSSVLSVTPVLLATLDDGVISAVAGDVRGWLGLPGESIDPESEVGAIVRAATEGARVIRDVAIGDRVFSVTCDPGPEPKTVFLTAYDITERAEAGRRLEGLVRSKDQFIAAVSHELRTPLAAVLGFAEEVRDAMDDADPLRPMMDVVADQSAEMAAIIEDLLVVARSSFEAVPMAPRAIQLAQEAAAVAETIGTRLAAMPECHLQPAGTFADPIRVRQIIRNLLTNADRYGGERVVIRTYCDGDTAVLEIRDSGDPLPAALRDRIFEPYESSGPVGGQPAAIGLGLAVSRTLAELMGGTLVYEHDGEWSVFALRLPAGR